MALMVAVLKTALTPLIPPKRGDARKGRGVCFTLGMPAKTDETQG